MFCTFIFITFVAGANIIMQPYEVLYRFSSDHRRLRVELSEDAILLYDISVYIYEGIPTPGLFS